MKRSVFGPRLASNVAFSSIASTSWKGNIVDFIERIFGISPDGGSGLFEVLLFLIPIVGILAIRAWRKRRLRK
jgi:hypothetical protein